MSTYSLKCKSCGGIMDFDPEHAISFCPYCGEKVLIDVSLLSTIIHEKSETDRVRVREEAKTERQKLFGLDSDTKSCIAAVICLIAIGILAKFVMF